MKTIYDLTPEETAALEDIDRQIIALYQKKADIYMRARVKYITETPEEVKAVEREIINRSLMYNSHLFPKYGIVKFKKEESEE